MPARLVRLLSSIVVLGIAIYPAPACHGGLDAPSITTATPQFSTTISGTISVCTKNHGNPASGCTQRVRAVAAGGSCGAAPISETALAGSGGGSWTLQGLLAGTSYTVYGVNTEGSDTACSSATNVVTNAKPAAPSIFGVDAPNNRTITGSINSCSDDGRPYNNCTQSALAVDSGATCNANCSCTGPIRGSSAVSSGTWAIVDHSGQNIKPESTYRIYGKNDDGELVTCSNGNTLITTPATIDGCDKYAANYFAVSPDTTSVRGVRAPWQVEDAFATDWQFGGFTQAAILIGVNEKSLFFPNAESIEVGVSRGFAGSNILTYFTAWNNLSTDDFIEQSIPGSPSVGLTVEGRILNCALNPPQSGCKQPWNSSTSPREYAACIGGGCFNWDQTNLGSLAPGPGTPDFWIGFEATCNTYPGNGLPSSRINTTTVRDVQYRFLGNWANLHNLNPDPTLGKFPSPSTIHGTDCCNGLVPGTNDQCIAPLDFLFFFNTQTPKVCETF